METEQLHLKWGSQHSDLIKTFDYLLSTETMVDVTLVCEGSILKAHKLILSACSPLFQNLFMENPSQHPIVILQDIKYSDLKVLINFIYKGEICISRDQLTILFKTAELLKIKGLLDIKEYIYESSNSALRVSKNNFADSSNNVTESAHTNEFPSSLYKNEQSRKRSLSYNPENSDRTSSKRKSVCPLNSQSISPVAHESINKCQIPNSEETDFNLAIVKNEINTEEIIIPDRTVDEEILNEEYEGEKEKNNNERSTPLDNERSTPLDNERNTPLDNERNTSLDVIPLLIPISSEINENSKTNNNQSTSNGNKHLFVYYAPSRSLPLSLPQNHSGANSTVTDEISMNVSTPSTSYDDNLSLKDSEISLSGSSNSQFDKDINTLTEEEYKVTEEKSKFMCEICKRECSCQKSLNIHMKIHKKEAPFTCDICRVTFKWRQVFLNHMKRHSGKNPFKCDICTYCCKEREDMIDHIRLHVGDGVIICDICFRRYKTKNDLTRHLEIHTKRKDKSFYCKICQSQYSHKRTLDKHILTHETKKPLICEICKTSYSNKRSLNRHRLSHENA